jgi:hypothetical protein
MNATLEMLAREKEQLLARSTLCRLRLHRQARGVRHSLYWKRALVAAAAAPTTRRVAFGVALSLVGLSRVTRMIVVAGRIVIYAKLASSVIGCARALARRRLEVAAP